MGRNMVIIGVALLVLLCAGSVLLAANAAAIPHSVITADAGTLRVNGPQTTMTFSEHVHLTSTQNDAVLICQNLSADSVKNEITSARATDTTGTLYIVRAENGVPVKYRIDYTCKSVVNDTLTKRLHLQGGKGGSARLTITPVDDKDKRRATLTAGTIDYFLGAEESAQTALPVTFLQATGNAELTMTATQGTSIKKTRGTAWQISGDLEELPGHAGQFQQVFHFTQGTSAESAQPHLEVVDVDPAVPDNDKLDADAIIFYPEAEKNVKAKLAAIPVTMMQANGNVHFTAIMIKHAAKAIPKPLTAGKISYTMTAMPTNQYWNVQGQDFLYRLERTADKTGVRAFDRVLHVVGGGTDGLAHVTLTDRDTNTVSSATNTPAFQLNMDTTDWSMGDDATGTEGGSK